MGPTGPVRSGAGALWRVALCLCKFFPNPRAGPQDQQSLPLPPPFNLQEAPADPGQELHTVHQKHSYLQQVQLLQVSVGGFLAGPRPFLLPASPDIPLPWSLLGPMPWRPGTMPISSTVAMIHSPTPSAQCSKLGTLWPQREGSLRTWHCWWVLRRLRERVGPEPMCQ